MASPSVGLSSKATNTAGTMNSSMPLSKELKGSVEILPDRLYYMMLNSAPPQNHSKRHFFAIDTELVYWNFYLDFGPLNLGQLYRFCSKLNKKLRDPKLKDKVIIFYSNSHSHKRTNAAYLISSWSLLYLNKSPEEAFSPFNNFVPAFPPWHDATPTICTFKLTILDTLKGLKKAKELGFFNFEKFDIDEYEYFEQVENGDLNWCMSNKFIAFAGPQASKEVTASGYHTLCPNDYIPYFKKHNVTLVVRLNKKYYNADDFKRHGIDHVELEFLDGSNPPDHILESFLQRCESTSGVIAVHCKAGLGRTGSCIGAYLMKHYKFTAEEVIGWLRICRPGMVIGPQQHYLKEIQSRMWKEGDMHRAMHGKISRSVCDTSIETSSIVETLDSPVEQGNDQGDLLRLRREQQKAQINTHSSSMSSIERSLSTNNQKRNQLIVKTGTLTSTKSSPSISLSSPSSISIGNTDSPSTPSRSLSSFFGFKK